MVFFTLLCGLVGYGIGYWQGQQAQSSAISGDAQGGEQALSVMYTQTADPINRSPATTLEQLLAQKSWFMVDRWLAEHPDEVGRSQGKLLTAAIRANANKYDAVAMRRVLRVYLNAVPDDTDAWLLLSDLQQISGLPEAALETLFDVLALPLTAELAARVRIDARRIVGVIDAQLKARGAIAEREAFWRHVSQRDPYSDFYRLQWARALAAGQDFDDARRVLKETGTVDIAQSSIDELLARIEIADAGLRFTRDGDRLLSSVNTVSGLSLTLLVDTGANVTSLSKSALRAAAAIRLAQDAKVRTAGGVVTTGVYRVPELEVQGRRFKDVRVIELPVDLPQLDGLLGLDLLHQLNIDPLALDTS